VENPDCQQASANGNDATEDKDVTRAHQTCQRAGGEHGNQAGRGDQRAERRKDAPTGSVRRFLLTNGSQGTLKIKQPNDILIYILFN
jgi:hypothetical protein